MDRLERRLDATLKMVQAGMKMLVKMQEETRRERKENREFKIDTQQKINALIEAQMRGEEKFDKAITELTAAQKRTDAKLDRLIDSLARNRSNGHSR